MQVILNNYQWDFLTSRARFPGMVCGWGTGKRLDVDTDIRTTCGWKKMGDIVPGDVVFGRDGSPITVLIAHEIVTVPKAYRLRFDSGETILADPEHLWYTESCDEVADEARGRSVGGSVKTTEQIVQTIRTKNNYQNNHRIPVCAPLVMDEADLPIAPYTFGAWLGDGSCGATQICTEDACVLQSIAADGYPIRKIRSATNMYAVGVKWTGSLVPKLREMGVLHDKRIPACYLNGSIEQRVQLLWGLMDTDGCCDGRDGVCEFTTIRKGLADDVFELVGSLGIKARVFEGRATLHGRDCGPKYRINFKAKKRLFALDRKQQRVDEATWSQMSRRTNRWVVGYDVVEQVPMRCLTVDADDGLFLVTKSFIPTHNTLVLIQRAMKLSQCYSDNLGLVVRRVFKDLADSTIKDFELYTGLKVPMSTRDVVLPGSRSRIMFRHLEELTSGPTKSLIQNVNLGWFAIEQAEEMDTPEQFQMLRGRLRRRLAVSEQYFKAWEMRNKVFAESKTCIFCKGGPLIEGDDAVAGRNDPNTAAKGGWVRCESCGKLWNRVPDVRMEEFHDYLQKNDLRTGFVIANANGKNWVWRQWISPSRPNQEDFVGFQASTFDNEHNLPADFVRDLKSMEHGTETERRKYRRYVLNCHEEADIEGSYYLKLMQEARSDGRIGKCVPDRSVATHTVWDLGISDTTAIWWFQKVGREVYAVHYYENSGEPLEHYVRYVEDVGRRLKLHYGKHFWPHDGKKRDLATGKELLATAKEMGLAVSVLQREKRVVDGIERVRKLLPHCVFDESECSGGVDVLEHYQRRKNAAMSTDEKAVYSDTPLHDWSSNGADSFRYLSAAVRKLGGGMSVDEVRELQAAYS